MTDLSTVDLLLEWDKRRPRTQQTTLGMSEIGGCRRRVGYRLAGEPTSDPGVSIQAVMGTLIHDGIADVMKRMQAEGLIPSEDLIETEVTYAGVTGHTDRYRHHSRTVEDTKTTTARQVGWVRLHGPHRPARWQVHLYGAGLISQGVPVAGVAIDYLARDTGDEYRWEAPFDPSVVREALDWVDMVASAHPDELRRDHAPDSEFCKGCAYRRRCWGRTPPGRDPRVVLLREDPDAKRWAGRLKQAQDDKRDAEARIKEAKGALDGTRPSDDTPLDVGFEHLLRWKRGRKKRTDLDLVRADYATAGEPVPVKWTTETRLEFVPREPTDQVMVEINTEG